LRVAALAVEPRNPVASTANTVAVGVDNCTDLLKARDGADIAALASPEAHMAIALRITVLLVISGFVFIAGCRPPPTIGSPCETGVPAGSSDLTTVSVSALECQGRTCIRVGAGPALCSARCSQEEDCAEVAAGAAELCPGGFTCAAVAGAGAHACQRFCVCRDGLSSAPACAD
jgi:hypothetical protein